METSLGGNAKLEEEQRSVQEAAAELDVRGSDDLSKVVAVRMQNDHWSFEFWEPDEAVLGG